MALAVVLMAVGVPARAGQVTGSSSSTVRSAAYQPIDTGDRAAVRRAVLKRLRPALAVKVKWDGSVAHCRSGRPSVATQRATLKAVNFFRAMSGLAPITFDAKLSAGAQKAALIMDAESSLSHFPPRSWNCWSKAGAEAAGRSNLCLGCTGAESILEYMDDPGPGNKAAGHRRWLLYPYVKTMGSGVTSGASALRVIPSARVQVKAPKWVSWPTPGYFPNELEPGGRWSLSSSNDHADFSAARVAVRTAKGTRLKVVLHRPVEHGAPDYGSPGLVWEIGDLALPTGAKGRRIDVTVSGIRVWNATDTALTKKKVTHRYSVRFFNPDA
ncbi:CAP domain-containing protein [Kineosporia sp. J2-2]|uniref:CAP domain-containing protein n=1 Tax=Kineosporia corallincola TaxID=2835133 RepID=A0ABS5TGZ2_9ACTN|nr:CAP domain-containing protein [Kineosporia corallincola]MBT0769333.1 CAP domain-containing protein [Kineosporia corallincola]